MARIRVLVELPALLGEIVCAAVAEAPDMELLREGSSRGSADVVITTHEDGALPAPVEAARRLRVVAIDRPGRRSVLYRLDPRCTSLGELSGAQLTETIRGLVLEVAPAAVNWQPTG